MKNFELKRYAAWAAGLALVVVAFAHPTSAQYGNPGNRDYPRVRIDTSGDGSFNSRNAGSSSITRGWVDTSSGRPSVALSGDNNFRITFYGNITQANPDRIVMNITGSDRGRASGRAEVRLNRDNNEVESISVNGNLQGGSFNGSFDRGRSGDGGYGNSNGGGYGNRGYGDNSGYGRGGRGTDNYPRIRVDTSGRGAFSSRNAGSATITRGWVDTSSDRPSVALSGSNNYRITFYGYITESGSNRIVMNITDSDRGRASGRAEFRLNGDNNEVVSISVNGNVQGGPFNGNFSR
jgi:hypothetical protein